ncbi:hypothetical protein PSH81_19255 [Pseudomonas sp. FP2335]|uniref:hypothetical protein n=1 Tax=Pseudomonas sp. FP2335 TaxID=2954092 RepID=UPI0027329D29|nr:hypothetical protein [Pseudomonas sp. FP2335]WLH77858.1 hypothetical protein PSH81_19255 [Pseudomonas sp. FP2335]
MFRVNDNPSIYFREPYFPNNRDSHYDRRDTYRTYTEPHYHRCDRDHNANGDFPEFGPDRGYRHDRRLPDTHRDWDHRFDRRLPDTRHDRDYHPHRRLPETRHDRDYHPHRRLPETRHDRDYHPDRRLPDTRHDRDYHPDRRLPDTRHDRDYNPDRRLPDTRHERDCHPDRRLPDTRHDRDYNPDRRLPDSRRVPDVRPALDTSQTTRTIEAIGQLLDRIPNRKTEFDHGITSDDIRAGKYGTLPPNARKELEKLDEGQNYRLVILSSEKGLESAWIPTDENKPTLTQPLNDDASRKNIGHPIWDLPNIIKTNANSINLGVTSDDLKKGVHGKLSPEIKKSMDLLTQGKNYSLVSLPDYMGNDTSLLVWEEKGNRDNYVPIGSVDERSH